MSEPRTKAGRALLADLEVSAWFVEGGYAERILAIEAEAAHPEPVGLDVERLYEAIVAELVELWGEPSDGISVQVRPIVARNIANRYAALSTEGVTR